MARRPSIPRPVAAVAALVVLAAALGGGYAWGHHGSTSDGASGSTITSIADRASATAHDAADVTFAQQMTPHHQQALVMAKLADTRAGSTAVKTLAGQIEAAQQPEIDKMTGWLTAWGATAASDSGGMSGMSGMMSQSDMDKLATLSGAEFDSEFLTMMIGHHQGALTMAQAELTSGENADALALATSIELTQQAQINQMHALLQK